MTWDPITTPIDHVELGGLRTPGVAEIVNAGSPREWDERRGAYLSGASLRFKGIKLARFSIVVRLWESEQFEEWNRLATELRRPPSFERPEALDIVHPQTEQLGILAVVVEDVTQLSPDGDTGLWRAEIKVIEHRRLERVDGPPIVGSKTAPDGPRDAADILTEQRLTQLARERETFAALGRSGGL